MIVLPINLGSASHCLSVIIHGEHSGAPCDFIMSQTVDTGQSQHNHGGHIRGLLWDGQIPDCHGYRSDTLYSIQYRTPKKYFFLDAEDINDATSGIKHI